eukprot:2944562-Pyramimonas_sp.AAC.1
MGREANLTRNQIRKGQSRPHLRARPRPPLPPPSREGEGEEEEAGEGRRQGERDERVGLPRTPQTDGEG